MQQVISMYVNDTEIFIMSFEIAKEKKTKSLYNDRSNNKWLSEIDRNGGLFRHGGIAFILEIRRYLLDPQAVELLAIIHIRNRTPSVYYFISKVPLRTRLFTARSRQPFR